MKSPKLRAATPARRRIPASHVGFHSPRLQLVRATMSMSAEAGPVAHKPLFRVQVSPFLPGRSPLPRPELLALPDRTALELGKALNPGQTPGGCLSTPHRNLIVGRRGKGV